MGDREPALTVGQLSVGQLVLCTINAVYCSVQFAVLVTLCVWMQQFRFTAFPPDSDDSRYATAIFAFLILGCIAFGFWTLECIRGFVTCRPQRKFKFLFRIEEKAELRGMGFFKKWALLIAWKLVMFGFVVGFCVPAIVFSFSHLDLVRPLS